MKKLIMASCIVLLLACAGCGNTKGENTGNKKTEAVENPGDFIYQGKQIHFGETKKVIENQLKDAEGCSIVYSDQREDGTEVFVSALISSEKFETYKGIKVGDDKKEIEETFKNTISDGNTMLVVLDEEGEKAVSANVGEWGDSDYVLHYTLDDQDKISQIGIGDVAGQYFWK